MGGNMARRESRLFPILSAEERYPVYDRFMASGACFTSRAQFSSIGRGVRGVFGRSGWRHRYSLLKLISTLFPVIKKYASKGSNLVPTRLGGQTHGRHISNEKILWCILGPGQCGDGGLISGSGVPSPSAAGISVPSQPNQSSLSTSAPTARGGHSSKCSSGSGTPVRKISAHEFERGGKWFLTECTMPCPFVEGYRQNN